MFTVPLLILLSAQSRQVDATFVSKDKNLTLRISKQTGRFYLRWRGGVDIANAFGRAKLANGEFVSTDSQTVHSISSEPAKDVIGEALKVTVRHLSPGKPELRHTFWVYQRNAEIAIRLDIIDPKGQSSNEVAPITTAHPIKFPNKSELQSLFVPYDNDGYARYSSQSWTGESADVGSHEVGALYDDKGRHGLVVGSIDHDVWKSGVKFSKAAGLQLIAGVTSKFTHDTQPHGAVTGTKISSPRFVLGLYKDWRQGLERYGDLNAKVSPPLKWKGKVPFGWNSWSAHKSKLQASDADAALEFVRDELPGLRNDGTAYINLDSYYDNLSVEQRRAFVKKAHDAGLKAGIYGSPFVNWGEPDWKTAGGYLFRDLQLKDLSGNLLPKHDGAWPLDPTHPGTLLRIDQQLKEYAEQGFDYIKLDFMTHGALEGKHHDPTIRTGTEAYNFGMNRLLQSLKRHTKGKPFFVSLSIAPMFPHGYGHSRRISCDVFANIGSTEYLLNSQNYGWWTASRLYQFNDPDHACVYQAEGEEPISEAESRSRLTASVIGGGLLLQGDNLTNDPARARVKAIFSNQSLINLAKSSPQFRPVEGSIGSLGGDLFYYRESQAISYMAAFNFSKEKHKQLSLPLSRLGLDGKWAGRDLWTNLPVTAAGKIEQTLAPMDCTLIKLRR